MGDLLEEDKSFRRALRVWISKRLSDGKATEVTYHRLPPDQKVQFGEAMTKELSQVLVVDALRRFRRQEEPQIQPERLLRVRWLLVPRNAEARERKGNRLVILGYQHPKLTTVQTAGPTLEKMYRHFLHQAAAVDRFRWYLGDFSSFFFAGPGCVAQVQQVAQQEVTVKTSQCATARLWLGRTRDLVKIGTWPFWLKVPVQGKCFFCLRRCCTIHGMSYGCSLCYVVVHVG